MNFQEPYINDQIFVLLGNLNQKEIQISGVVEKLDITLKKKHILNE